MVYRRWHKSAYLRVW